MQSTSSDFDPRAPSYRTTSHECLQASVQDLLSIFPDSSLGHLWGISPQPPEIGITVEVSTSPSLQQEADQLILELGLYTAQSFKGKLHS